MTETNPKIEMIRGFLISILFWIIILFTTNKYVKIIGGAITITLFSMRYWDLLFDVIKKDKQNQEVSEVPVETEERKE